MTTTQAFDHLTAQRGWYAQTGIHPDTARSLKRLAKQGKLDESKMKQLLQSAGYNIVQERIWAMK
jgi:hypothetical protein